jgi:hypothetical protein
MGKTARDKSIKASPAKRRLKTRVVSVFCLDEEAVLKLLTMCLFYRDALRDCVMFAEEREFYDYGLKVVRLKQYRHFRFSSEDREEAAEEIMFALRGRRDAVQRHPNPFAYINKVVDGRIKNVGRKVSKERKRVAQQKPWNDEMDLGHVPP